MVLGIDPGTANCGFALLDQRPDQVVVRDLGTFRSDADTRLRDRVNEYTKDLLHLVDETKPHVVVAEAPGFPKGAIAAAMVWSAFTGLTAICQARDVELVLRNPGEWRRMLQLPEHKLPPAKTTDAKVRARLAREAQAKRKADTEELMRRRWPGAPALLESFYTNAREHAYDALAIATSWLDRATATQAAPTSAQGELAWHAR
jgi:Holliday junction resolvasome RuvABC endonuclease subunit